VAFFSIFYPLAYFTFFVLLLALLACLITVTAKTSRELILALQLTSLAALGYRILLGLAFALPSLRGLTARRQRGRRGRAQRLPIRRRVDGSASRCSPRRERHSPRFRRKMYDRHSPITAASRAASHHSICSANRMPSGTANMSTRITEYDNQAGTAFMLSA
jgi:hypothetical protein